MAVYDNTILINLQGMPDKSALYEKDYVFDRLNFRIEIYQKGICVHAFVGNKINIWDFEKNMVIIHDAFRKAYILYTLYNGNGLEINNIRILIDGVELYSIGNNEDIAYPYVYSMLGNTKVIRKHDMPGKNSVFCNRAIADHISTSKRSVDQNDKRIVAMFAFLLGRSREYEMDRFLNYWTAINAVYGYLCLEHNKRIKKMINNLPEEKLEEAEISADELKELLTPVLAKKDMLQIKIFAKLLRKKYNTGRNSVNNDIDKLLQEFNNDYHDAYKFFSESYVDDNGKIRFSFEKLYSLITGESRADNDKQKEEYAYFEKWAGKMGISTYALLTIYEPYYMRNYYIHGNETQMMISDTYHLNLLSCLNYFMDRLLCDFIPALFDEGSLIELLSIVHGIIYDQEKGNKKDTDTKAKKLAQKVKKGQWIIGKELTADTDNL